MILNERESRHEHVLHVARQMMTAARTAPKGKGVDIIEIAMVTDGDINILSEMMVKMVAEHGMKFFLRDAENILNAECVLLIVWGIERSGFFNGREKWAKGFENQRV